MRPAAIVLAFVFPSYVAGVDLPAKPKLEPGKVYVFNMGTKASDTSVEPAPEWLEIAALQRKGEGSRGEGRQLLVDGVIVRAEVVPPILGLSREGVVAGADTTKLVAVKVLIADFARDRKKEYARWTNQSLTDDLKNSYEQLKPLDQPVGATVRGNSARFDTGPTSDVLLFETPVLKARELFLTLDGKNLGLADGIKLRFKFPRAAIDQARAAEAELRLGK